MRQWPETGRRWYGRYARGLSYLGDLLLLGVRLYWGSLLAVSGWNKFANLHATAAYFESLGIFWPKFNAILSGGVELGCGALLVIGLASRIVAVPLVINMLVAYVTNSGEAIRHLFTNANEFVTAPEFLFLFACMLVLVFGPGAISIDGLLGLFLRRSRSEESPAQRATADRHRREFAKLSAAAFVGVVAGILFRTAQEHARNVGKDDAAGPKTGPGRSGNEAAEGGSDKSVAGNGGSGSNVTATTSAKPPPTGTDINLLLAGEPHVCRGLNTCRGKAKDHKNSCAGQGSCATAESHACNGQNVCKGQGGCAQTAGINLCKGQGACAVPLKDATWKLARARFEQLAKTKGLEIGAAPAKTG